MREKVFCWVSKKRKAEKRPSTRHVSFMSKPVLLRINGRKEEIPQKKGVCIDDIIQLNDCVCMKRRGKEKFLKNSIRFLNIGRV